MEIVKVSKEEFEKMKKEVKELSDEDLDKVAGGEFRDDGGYFCDPGCLWMGNACFCEDW